MDAKAILRRIRLGRLLPVLTFLVAFVLIAGTLWSCIKQQIVPTPPPAPAGIPEIRVLLTAAPVSSAQLGTAGPGGYALLTDGAPAEQSPQPMPETAVARSGGGWNLGGRSVPGTELVLRPTGQGYVQVGEAAYRGRLRLLPVGDSQFVIINHLDIESYLAGVLPRELYSGWSSEAYRALAVAARTFALYHKLTGPPDRSYDVGSDQSAQVYGGLSAETDKSWDAVEYTRGIVLTAGEPDKERIFLAQYSACCGGRVNGAGVIRNAPDLPPLAGGQVCEDCAACSRYRWPDVRIAKTDLRRALAVCYPAAAMLKDASAIRIVTATPYGRAIWTDIVDSAGKSVRVRAEDIRLALLRSRIPAARGLYSMNCTIRNEGNSFVFADGRGFGHGVGLCQWGAQGKAAAGWSAEAILEFYYPGAVRLRAY